ncbi:MAG TPA: hypothetical protein VM582_05670 [Candidatus Thermoplasmatota archaeon]|nr:hypothetical protein [Candidatus Thermoplasmatota archaeon]
MRTPLAAFVVLLLLLAPHAAARHPDERDLVEEIKQGRPVFVYINSSVYGRASHDVAESDDTYAASSKLSWTYRGLLDSEFVLRWDNATGTLRGTASVDTLFSGQRTHAATERIFFDGELIERTEVRNDCTLQHGGAGAGRTMTLPVEAEVDESARAMRIDMGMWAIPHLTPASWRDCTWRADVWGAATGSSTQRDAGAKPELVAMVLASEELARGEDPDPLWVDVPLDGGIQHVIVRDYVAPLEAEEDHPAHWFCARDSEFIDPVGLCHGGGTLEFRFLVDPCAAIMVRYREHLDILRQAPPAEVGAPEAWLLTWLDEQGKKVADALGDVREYVIACGGEDELAEEPMGEAVDLIRGLIEALDHLLRTTGLSERGLRELLNAERQMQLLGAGYPDTQGLSAARSPPGANGKFVVQVHSPVSLAAWSADGRRVGWDAAAGASEVGIEGATYEGAPGGWQRITLPAGFYKLQVDELAKGNYILEVDWEGGGAKGGERHLVRSEAGRSTMTHYALDRVDDDGRPLFDVFPVRRLATPAEHRFIDDVAATRAAADGAPAEAPRAGAASGAGADATGAAAGGDEGGSAVPAPGALALVALLAGLAWRRRLR